MDAKYTIEPFPPIRRATIDMLEASSKKHMIHGLIEVDITESRQKLRTLRVEKDQVISLSSLIISCCARAVTEDRHVHACRDAHNRLYLFDDVDISTPVEREINGRPELLPVIIRKADKKSLVEISSQIEDAKKSDAQQTGVYKAIKWYLTVPSFVKSLVFKIMGRSPLKMKDFGGTVMVSCLNMFGSGTGWGVPIASHTLNVTSGGMTIKPVLVKGNLENHEFLCLTVSVDHDLVDGAPLARFINRFKKLLEQGTGILESCFYPKYRGLV